ncbi:hypothetical protein MMC29_000897, partial [Sticta canariensis]|nr:hypothetical protein [Sticta canariensis]
ACIISVIRVYYSVRIFQTKDVTYNAVIFALWSHAEVTFGILCGCLPVLPKFISALRQKISTHSKTYVQIRTIFQWFRISRYSGKRGDAGSSECTGSGPYDFQGKWNSDEVCEIDPVAKRGSTVTSSAEVRSLAPTVGDSTTNLKCGEEGPSANRILKTVLIETVQEPRDDPGLDLEMQRSCLAW